MRFGFNFLYKINMAKKGIDLYTAAAIVIANMIGTGVFTSLGYQTVDIKSIFALLMLWIVGGIIAFCGALAYGELAAMMPRSGGEYYYLGKIYHPLVGFLSGWVSATVGFAAPIAAAAMALGKYTTSVLPTVNGTILAIIVVLILTVIHSADVALGSKFQKISTAVKVVLIFIFIVAGFFTSTPQAITILPEKQDWSLLFSAPFAISLIYVSYAYSGWNASAYLANEIENPKKNVPKSIFFGTLLVMVAYALLNFVFLYTVPVSELAARQAADFSKPLEVGYLSAGYIFGTTGGKIMGMMIALLLVSSVSSMIFAGPRVTQAMGEDIPLLKKLAQKNSKGIPIYAILLQSAITIVLILTSSFDAIITYVGFTLSLFTFLTVLGLFILRVKQPQAERPYKAWGYPITPIIFLSLTLWTIIFLLKEKTTESLAGLVTLVVGVLIYLLDKSMYARK